MNIENKFCLGISKPFDILNSDIRKLIKFTITNKLYVHASITYPINFIFIRKLLKKKQEIILTFVKF